MCFARQKMQSDWCCGCTCSRGTDHCRTCESLILLCVGDAKRSLYGCSCCHKFLFRPICLICIPFLPHSRVFCALKSQIRILCCADCLRLQLRSGFPCLWGLISSSLVPVHPLFLQASECLRVVFPVPLWTNYKTKYILGCSCDRINPNDEGRDFFSTHSVFDDWNKNLCMNTTFSVIFGSSIYCILRWTTTKGIKTANVYSIHPSRYKYDVNEAEQIWHKCIDGCLRQCRKYNAF